MICKYCSRACIKRGKRKNVQCYQCTTCKKYQQKEYKKLRIPASKYAEVHNLVNKGIRIPTAGGCFTTLFVCGAVRSFIFPAFRFRDGRLRKLLF